MKEENNTSTLDEIHYLDSIQLKALEDSFRDWTTASKRIDVNESRMRIFLVFLLIRYTGAKLNEILSADPERDIDLENNLITLGGRSTSTKNIPRTIPLPQTLTEAIQIAVEEQKGKTDGKTIFSADPGFVRRKFYERAEACGFDKTLGSPESIRKARTSELLNSNMPVPAVQSLLGNSTPSLTHKMLSFSEEELQRLTQTFLEKESGRKSSARNSFYGKVEHIEVGGIFSRVEMVSIDGFPVTAIITNGSLLETSIKSGSLVTAQVKAPMVMLQKQQDGIPCSAENQFQGVISSIHKGAVNTEYVVRISDMTEICSVITTKSSKQLELTEGGKVTTLFNSFSVVLLAE